MLVQSNRRFALNLILVLFAAIFLLIFVIQIITSENPLWLLLGRSFASAITITFLLTNWPGCYSFLVRRTIECLFYHRCLISMESGGLIFDLIGQEFKCFRSETKNNLRSKKYPVR